MLLDILFNDANAEEVLLEWPKKSNDNFNLIALLRGLPLVACVGKIVNKSLLPKYCLSSRTMLKCEPFCEQGAVSETSLLIKSI